MKVGKKGRKTKKRAFIISKVYRYKRQFKIRKTGPLKRVIENIKSLFSKSKEIKIKAYEKEKSKYRMFSSVAFVVAIALGLTALFLIYFISILNSLPHAEATPPALISSITNGYIVNFGSIYSKTNGFYSTMNISTNGKVNIYSIVYKKPIITSAYILKGPGYESNSFDEMLIYLRDYLQKVGISVSEIGINQIDMVPKGSILIVAKGKPPYGSLRSIINAAYRGVHVFYVGLEPTEEIDSNGKFHSRIGVLPKDISFMRQKLTPDEGLNMIEGVYTINNGNLIYNSISYINIGNGTIVVFPNLPDVGWTNGKALAEDITTVITSLYWMGEPISITQINGGNGLNSFFTNPIEINDAYIVYKIVSISKVINKKAESVGIITTYGHTLPSSIYPQDTVFLPFSIKDIPMQIYITPICNDKKVKNDNVWIEILNGSGVVDKINVGYINTNTESVVSYSNKELTSGNYLIKVYGEKCGLYGIGGFQLGKLSIFVSNVNNDKIDIRFYLLNRMVKLSNIEVDITRGDGVTRSVNFEKASNITVDLDELFDHDVPVGTYNVTIKVGDNVENISVEKFAQTGIKRLLSPTNIIILLLSGIVYVIGVIFAKKEEEFFYIDIPDFPPLESIEIKITVDDMKEIFEKINKFYKWKYTPMTLSEIKSGFRMIEHNGSPIYISDFNLEFLLDKLKSKGIVRESLGYYGLTEWEKKSGFTMDQLAMFRKMRDICLLNAIRFTELSRKKEYHTMLNIIWQKAYVFFYSDNDRDMILKNALNLTQKGIVMVIFPSDEEKMKFTELLRSNSKLANAFYVNVKTGDISLLTIDEFEEKISEIRRM